MNTDVAVKWVEQVDAPLTKYNKLVKENVEVLTALHLQAIRTYSEMGLTKIKAASESADGRELAQFSPTQLRVLAELAQKMLDDSDKLHQVALRFKDDVKRLNLTEVKKATSA